MHQLFLGFKPISGLGSLQMGKMVIIWPGLPCPPAAMFLSTTLSVFFFSCCCIKQGETTQDIPLEPWIGVWVQTNMILKLYWGRSMEKIHKPYQHEPLAPKRLRSETFCKRDCWTMAPPTALCAGCEADSQPVSQLVGAPPSSAVWEIMHGWLDLQVNLTFCCPYITAQLPKLIWQVPW